MVVFGNPTINANSNSQVQSYMWTAMYICIKQKQFYTTYDTYIDNLLHTYAHT